MKHLLHTTIAILALALPSQALEQRTFQGAKKNDSGKIDSFAATLTAYDAKKKSVTVINQKGKSLSFPLNVISEDCQAYVLSKEALLNISKNVTLRFTESKDPKSGDAVPTGYAIEVYNRGKDSIEDVTLKYTLYYKQGDLEAGGTVAKTQEGEASTGKMYDSDTLTVETSKVYIVRKSKPASGGG